MSRSSNHPSFNRTICNRFRVTLWDSYYIPVRNYLSSSVITFSLGSNIVGTLSSKDPKSVFLLTVKVQVSRPLRANYIFISAVLKLRLFKINYLLVTELLEWRYHSSRLHPVTCFLLLKPDVAQLMLTCYEMLFIVNCLILCSWCQLRRWMDDVRWICLWAYQGHLGLLTHKWIKK
jgi:hypothetical protein